MHGPKAIQFHLVCFKGVKRETAEEFEFGNYNLFEDSKDAFASLNTTYDRTKFDRLTKLMAFNVNNNANVILDTIKRTIEVKLCVSRIR